MRACMPHAWAVLERRADALPLPHACALQTHGQRRRGTARKLARSATMQASRQTRTTPGAHACMRTRSLPAIDVPPMACRALPAEATTARTAHQARRYTSAKHGSLS